MIKENARQMNHYSNKVNTKMKPMSHHQNSVIVYELYPAKKVIVQSPQPGDVGELTERDKIC